MDNSNLGMIEMPKVADMMLTTFRYALGSANIDRLQISP